MTQTGIDDDYLPANKPMLPTATAIPRFDFQALARPPQCHSFWEWRPVGVF